MGVGHILRLLATFHWIREVRPNVFANNRLSALIDSGKTPEEIHDRCSDTPSCSFPVLT